MSTYERAIAMEVDPDLVFGFVSNPDNLQYFLPTVHRAQKLEGDRIRIQGVSHGHPYDNEGYFRTSPAQRRIEWGSEGVQGYSGWMEVRQGDTSPYVSEITMELNFSTPPGDQAGEAVLAEMEEALRAIRNQVARR